MLSRLRQKQSEVSCGIHDGLGLHRAGQFDEIVRKAQSGNWRSLPIGDRIIKFAKEFEGVPYKGYTLEIHDKIESPSANLYGLDCWTFFEISLGLARMIDSEKTKFLPTTSIPSLP